MRFDVDVAGNNFSDSAIPAATAPVQVGGVTTPTHSQLWELNAVAEEDPTLAPPTAKKPRIEPTTTVTTLHPVSELTQKYQGAIFEFTGT